MTMVVDYYCRYFELERMPTTNSAAVINKMKSIFSRHGNPEKVVSDNGTQFSAQESASFAKEWAFSHVASSPTNPQSNGLAEKAVHTAEQLLNKVKLEQRDPYLSLLE